MTDIAVRENVEDLEEVVRIYAQIETIENIDDIYKYQVRHWTQWMRETGNGVDQDGVKEYFLYLQETGYKAGTIRNKRQAVKKRLRQIYRKRSIEERIKLDRYLKDLDEELKAPKTNTNAVPRDRVLNRAEYNELLLRSRSAKQMAFIRFLWQTGARVSELTGLKLSKCKVGEKTVDLLLWGKGSKERHIKIQRDLYDFIRDTFRGETYLFETSGGKPYQREYISTQIKKLGKLIGRDISAHIFRHSWATIMVHDYPEKLAAISTYLGHSSRAITLNMYVHDELTDEELFS